MWQEACGMRHVAGMVSTASNRCSRCNLDLYSSPVANWPVLWAWHVADAASNYKTTRYYNYSTSKSVHGQITGSWKVLFAGAINTEKLHTSMRWSWEGDRD